ncbi:MAG: thioredoxin [Candidatus Buchananbacteria bacterium CG10_big_fil_rev_8_21_14_0_10_42_9]|uniref:Thioredoxin n=1 Tax=Candidatus Buchananbacteria bacterium CG10_big_fil_rev_8_21_14_0_10_42_9 TaxID=1974526 RepID=A0A2H0W1I4_9BACT|nr:MAG: thioredoxin [Candidatus Buchananbacteria bacterium CG10_big_fil_rev_8_21_14_0_10_42_9]
MAELILTDDTFEQEVLKSDKPVLVDFWAPWCGPCKVQGPVIEEISREYTKAKIAKMNVDENPETPGKYQILSIPTLIIFKGGEEVDRMIGVQEKEQLISKLDAQA